MYPAHYTVCFWSWVLQQLHQRDFWSLLVFLGDSGETQVHAGKTSVQEVGEITTSKRIGDDSIGIEGQSSHRRATEFRW